MPAGPSAVGTYGVQAWKPTNGIGVEKPGLHTCGRAGGPGSGGRAGSAGRLPSGRLGGAGSPIGGNPTDGSAAPVAAPAPTEGATVSAFIPIPGKPTPGRAMFATGSCTWASAKSDGEAGARTRLPRLPSTAPRHSRSPSLRTGRSWRHIGAIRQALFGAGRPVIAGRPALVRPLGFDVDNI